jgi:hypothetical protein
MSQQGPWGPRGPTGVTGMTGRRGLQGFPYGPQGANFFSPQGRFTYSNTTTNSISPTTSTYGLTYIIGTTGLGSVATLSNGTSGYITNVTLPASMVSDDAGAYWVFSDNTGYPLQINITNGTATYYGSTSATTIYTASSIVLAYSGTGTSYITL